MEDASDEVEGAQVDKSRCISMSQDQMSSRAVVAEVLLWEVSTRATAESGLSHYGMRRCPYNAKEALPGEGKTLVQLSVRFFGEGL